MQIDYKKYLNNPKFYGTNFEALALKIEHSIIERSWCDDDSKLDNYDYVIELAKNELFKIAGDSCLIK